MHRNIQKFRGTVLAIGPGRVRNGLSTVEYIEFNTQQYGSLLLDDIAVGPHCVAALLPGMQCELTFLRTRSVTGGMIVGLLGVEILNLQERALYEDISYWIKHYDQLTEAVFVTGLKFALFSLVILGLVFLPALVALVLELRSYPGEHVMERALGCTSAQSVESQWEEDVVDPYTYPEGWCEDLGMVVTRQDLEQAAAESENVVLLDDHRKAVIEEHFTFPGTGSACMTSSPYIDADVLIQDARANLPPLEETREARVA